MTSAEAYKNYVSINEWLKNPNYKKEKLPRGHNQVLPRRGRPFKPEVGGGMNERHDDAFEHLKGGRTFTLHGVGKRYGIDQLKARQILITICRHKDMMLEAVGVEDVTGKRGAKPVVYRLVKES